MTDPPSTAIVWPVTFVAFSDSRNATISAMSAGVWGRPIGTICATKPAKTCSGVAWAYAGSFAISHSQVARHRRELLGNQAAGTGTARIAEPLVPYGF